MDFFNPEEKRTLSQAGTTFEERQSFANNLLGHRDPNPARTASGVDVSGQGNGSQAQERHGLVDTFRMLYPEARGVFTYWSMRAGNRPFNRGMRLDFCLASQSLAGDGEAEDCNIHDAFVLDKDTVGVSDHCPVGLILRT